MTSLKPTVLYGKPYVQGSACARLLAADLELSFWGGVDPKTGEVIDRFHPLSGQLLKDTILAIPGGRGSCGGSVVMTELMLNGLGPKALIFERPEEILTLGVFVAEEMFGLSAPVLMLSPSDFRTLLAWEKGLVYVKGDRISSQVVDDMTAQQISGRDGDFSAEGLRLSENDKAMLGGSEGEAARTSMRIILRVAEMMGAKEFISITQAHVDPAYYGAASLAFGEKLRDQGAKFRVPATMNSINIDAKRWRSHGLDEAYGDVNERLTKAYLDMGGRPSFTCAPYLLDTSPNSGDAVAWGESNAVIYANSILGARTLKNPNMLECLIAITGRAPKASMYLDENRLATLWISTQPPEFLDDVYWPILGYSAGAIANTRIPVITGLEHLRPSKDDFKAFSAAFATSSSAPMFHMVNLTREAPTLEAASAHGQIPPRIELTESHLQACWDEFNHGSTPRKIDLISLGNPHFSFQEIKTLANLCQGRAKHADVSVMITCGRSQHGLATQAGFVEQLEAFGVQFITDTCWCSISEPLISKTIKTIMTNSGKYIHYGPGLTGRQFCFGSLEMCVDAACSGVSTGEPPRWLHKA